MRTQQVCTALHTMGLEGGFADGKHDDRRSGPAIGRGPMGGMLFFAAVYAPLIFLRLEGPTAGRFLRQVFPVYYATMGICSAVSAMALAVGTAPAVMDSMVLVVVSAGFWIARLWLVPNTNRARDASLAGDTQAARQFSRLHRASVILNAIQLLAVVLGRFVSR